MMIKAIQAPEHEEVAIHEAGHVSMIMAILGNRANIVFATIVGGHTAAGETIREGWPSLLPKDRAQVLMAGMAAQVLACEKRNPGVNRPQAFDEYSDRCRTDLRMLEDNHGIPRERAVILLGECAEKLDPHWSGLLAIVGELLEHGTLYHQEAGLIFDGDHQALEWYRKNRRSAPPPPEWAKRVSPGSIPGPWIEPMSFLDKLRCLRERIRQKRRGKP